MRFGKISAAALAAVMAATSVAVVVSAEDEFAANGTVEFADFGVQIYGMGTSNWSWVTGAQATLEGNGDKATATITADTAELNPKGDDKVQFGIQFYVNTNSKGEGELAVGDSFDGTASYKFTSEKGTIKEETVNVKKKVSKNQYGPGIDGTAYIYQVEIPKADLEAYGKVTATVEISDLKYTKDGKEGVVSAAVAAEPAADTAAASSDDLAAALENLSEEDKAKLQEVADAIEANLTDEDKAKLQEIADTLGNMSEEEIAALQEQVTAAVEEIGASLEALLENIDPAEIEAIKAAAEEANANFALGGKIDLIAALGMNWNKFTKVEADFSWTPGTGWCGGAGIGGGADVEGGSGWIAGPEYGAANANAGVVDDGFATQTIIDLNGQHLASVASLNEDGTISFGEMQIQKWWNCDEANAKILAIRFLDDNGEVLAELVAPDAGRGDVIDESFAAPVETATAGDVAAATESSKGSPDTGIADVAAIAGLAVVAGGAIVISKKRK